MRNWTLHAGWALATVLVAAAWGRWCTPPSEPGIRRRAIATESLPPVLNPPEPQTQTYSPATSSTAKASPADSDVLPGYTFELLTVDEIRRLIHTDVAKDQWRAIRAVDKLVDQRLKKELLLAFLPCKDEDLRYGILMKLAALIGQECLPLMQKALVSDPSAWIRRNAATQLGTLGGEGTIEALLQAAHDDDLYVQVNVAAALNRLGQPGAVSDLLPRLTKDLDHPDDAVRREAVENLAALKSAQVIPFLIRALKDANGDVRQQANVGLARLEVPEVVPAMEALKKDPAMAEAAREILEYFQSWNSRKK